MSAQIHIPLRSPLQDYVTAIWEAKATPGCRETILPQGIVEIIFNFSDPMSATMPEGFQILKAPRCFIQGMNTNVVQVNCSGYHHLFGIRLHPHMIKSMFGILPSELKNSSIDLSLLRPGFDELWEQLAEAKDFNARVNIIENNFSIPINKACQRSGFLSNLFLSGGVDSFQSVETLAKEVCYSTRQLNRITNNLFGISAEELTVYKKFKESVNYMHVSEGSLTDVAYQAGFYDQSHFCKVFKSYTGITAKNYRDSKSATPFHIFS